MPQAKRSSSRRRSARKDGESQVDRQKATSNEDESQEKEQQEQQEQQEEQEETTTETAEPSPPVEQTKPEDFARQEHELRVEHNARTGGGDVHEGELQAQREEHNERTGDASR